MHTHDCSPTSHATHTHPLPTTLALVIYNTHTAQEIRGLVCHAAGEGWGSPKEGPGCLVSEGGYLTQTALSIRVSSVATLKLLAHAKPLLVIQPLSVEIVH
jgi:hypothetical protein